MDLLPILGFFYTLGCRKMMLVALDLCAKCTVSFLIVRVDPLQTNYLVTRCEGFLSVKPKTYLTLYVYLIHKLL